ncbi:MAG: Holliday junction branch migration protein RuvA [Coriobacteriia bacterium]|nr:Holliday junction branch migration protein RuvA [Coriobacteriia bacterium]
MFAHLHGTLTSVDANGAVIDVNGVGFKLGMSALSVASLGAPGTTITVYTCLIMRNDAMDLYGFIDTAERELFERLISVSGVGPKVALSALSSFNSVALQQMIIDEDVKRLTSIPGLGKKTAQRMILELRGSLVALDDESYTKLAAASKSVSAQVTDALLGMGFTKREIELASVGYEGPNYSVEEHIRFALQRLGG